MLYNQWAKDFVVETARNHSIMKWPSTCMRRLAVKKSLNRSSVPLPVARNVFPVNRPWSTTSSINLRTLELTVNNELEKVSEWLNANKLTLNFKKSNNVIFRPRQKRIPFIPQIKIFNPTLNTRVTLEMKDFVKYLGIMIDSELSWKHHIDFICHKISRSVGIIAKMRHYIPRHLLLNLYHALIAPYLNYGICAWGNCPQTYLNKILVLQKRALRLIYFLNPETMRSSFLLNQTVFLCSRCSFNS